MSEYLTEVTLDEESPLVGRTVAAVNEEIEPTVVQVVRDGEGHIEPFAAEALEAGDALVVRADVEELRAFATADGLAVRATDVGERDFAADERQRFVELVVPTGSSLVDVPLSESPFGEGVNLLSIRRGTELLHHRLGGVALDRGDTILVQATAEHIKRLASDPDVIVARELDGTDYRTAKLPVAVGIVLAVVGLAAFGVLDILVAALAGVVAMVLGGVLDPDELYDAVEWDVIFLLAGLIPLGIAFSQTGAAGLIGALVAESAQYLPPLGVLWVFYVITALTTAVVSNAGSVVLMIPVGVATAVQIGANPFAFVLAVTFAASADFMTPIGYQTNCWCTARAATASPTTSGSARPSKSCCRS